MDEQNATPFVVALFFVIRCLIPLAIMIGISFILRKLGLISEPPKKPSDQQNNNSSHHSDKGGLAHA